MTCASCRRFPAMHTNASDSLCGVCAAAEQVVTLGECEGRAYEAQPHLIHGLADYWEVYEVSADARRFLCTLTEWPKSAAARRMRL